MHKSYCPSQRLRASVPLCAKRLNLCFRSLLFGLAVVAAPIAAHAGNPLFVDPATGLPIHYNGTVRVFTDLGNLGMLTNQQADAKVGFSWKQWTDVPSSSFEAQVAGDFASIGLPDITAANAGDVIGTNNGGGIHVIYDTDGTVLSDFFGAPPSVLGIASPEIGVDGTPEITESWVILNGAAIDPADTDGSAFAGVMTHEFGHSINLGHSQVNGANIFFSDPAGPAGCESFPYGGAPEKDDVETMYPFLDVAPATGTGIATSTVDITDDIVSLSNIYPAAGWPQSAGSISGTITFTDGTSQIAGINVVARNVANPFRDALSAMSGDVTRAFPGTEGQYRLNGLTPGAEYVVYVDGIYAGGFSTPPAIFFPGAEEFFSGAVESGNATTDGACVAEPISAAAGVTTTANIAFNTVPGAPVLRIIGSNISTFGMTADGKTIVGFGTDLASPAFRYTEADGVVSLGGVGSTAAIAANGSAIVSNTLQDDGFQVASLWLGGTEWQQLPGLDGDCDGALPVTKSVAFGVSNSGRKVVGLGFLGEHCDRARAFQWDAATGVTSMLETPDEAIQSRANGITGDGSVVWGFTVGETGFRDGAIWQNGRLRVFGNGVDIVGEAYGASPNGKIVVGGVAGNEGQAWRWTERTGVETIGTLPGFFYSSAFATNAKGTVITGQSVGFEYVGFIWTRGMGMVRIDDFLRSQGVTIDPTAVLYSPNTMSADGRRIGGVGGSFNGTFSWFIDLDKLKVCHVPRNHPENARTIEVAFPTGFDRHLAHGDTLGDCPVVRP